MVPPRELAATEEDRSTVDLLVESLMPGRQDAVRRIFAAQGARAPTILWSPEPHELRSPLLTRFAEICQSVARSNGHVHAEDLDLEAFQAVCEWLMLLEEEPDGTAFRYVIYGRGIADVYGKDMTGRTTADFPGHIARFFTALYLASLRRGEWVLSEHEPPRQVFVRAWRRLIVPLVTRTDTPKRLIALNTAENELRAGLELLVDPVFVMDENRVVHYANRSARLLFGISKRPDAKATLSEMTGFDLDLAMSPTEMLGQRRVLRDVEMTVLQNVIHRFAVTVSPAMHRQSVFYVVVCRKLLD